jgi:hypothetical protein
MSESMTVGGRSFRLSKVACGGTGLSAT